MSGAVLAVTWWIFCFIIVSIYSANLANFLTVSRLDPPITSLDDLVGQSKVKFSFKLYSYVYYHFKQMATAEIELNHIWTRMSLNGSLESIVRGSELPILEYPLSRKYTKIWERLSEVGFPDTRYEGLQLVLESKSYSEGFAYIDYSRTLKIIAMTDCNYKLVGEEFAKRDIAIALQKGSPLKDPIDAALLKLRHHGVMKRLKEKWWDNSPERKSCPKEPEVTDGLTIHYMGGVFLVFYVGAGLAIIVLLFEYCWSRIERFSRRKAVARRTEEHTVPKCC